MGKWFKNKETDVCWEVTTEALIQRLENDQTFEEVNGPEQPKEKQKKDKATANEEDK